MTVYVAARSNHFRVRDEKAFLAWVDTLPGVGAYRDTPRNNPDDPEGHPNPSYALLADGFDCGWPSWRKIVHYEFDEAAYVDFGERRMEQLRAAGLSEERLKLAGAAMSAEYFRRVRGAQAGNASRPRHRRRPAWKPIPHQRNRRCRRRRGEDNWYGWTPSSRRSSAFRPAASTSARQSTSTPD